MAYTYSSYVTALSKETNIAVANADFQAILPTIIDEAEQRIYRDMQLLATIVRDRSAATTPNARNFTLPQTLGRFVVVQSINVINAEGQRIPLTKVSREVMDLIWPFDGGASDLNQVPTKYAPVTDQTFLFGPPAGSAFEVEVVGTIRPAAMSESNPQTFLSQYLPDLLLAAGMVAMSAYMRNFGAQSDDPKMALSWEGSYQTRLSSANREEMMRTFQAFSATGGF